jgi:hypothetical protein
VPPIDLFRNRVVLSRLFFSASIVLCTHGLFAEEPPAEVLGLPLLDHDTFSTEDVSRWEPADPLAWRWQSQAGNGVFQQFAQSQVKTPVRSPFNRCILKDLAVEDFVLDVRLQSTARDYGHRSLCLFFGYQDPAHMYYVHFGQKTDDHANQVFIVNNEPRKKISLTTTPGTPWDHAWHRARIVRKVASGEITVYFDDLETPVMTAVDKTFTWGQIGIGSFDDSGNFDDIRLYGVRKSIPAQ